MTQEQFENSSPLDTDIDSLVEKFNFGKDYKIVRIDNVEKFNLIKGSELGMDSRAKAEQTDGYSTVFEGLAFDPENVRTQAYYLENGEKPVAVITFAITPRKILANDRYFKKKEGGVEICDLTSLTGEIPEFTISPAWTKVDKEHRTKFALPGFKMVKEILAKLKESAPDGSWIETAAQGKGHFYNFLASKKVGQLIPNEELPFNIKDFGQPTKGSVSTVKMAELFKIPQFPDIGSFTLGPVFIEKIINNKE